MTPENALSQPEISVVVIITDGAPNLGRCLRALEKQRNAPWLEILVPVHPELEDTESIRREHPSIKCIFVDNLPFTAKPDDPGLRHIVYDYRRSAGLRAARGRIIAMTEDHAIPPEAWCANILSEHASMPHAAIGGAIDPACHTHLSWAAYFGEFIRYQNPVPIGPSEYISDVNVAYKREALEGIRNVWQRAYHETAVHGALRSTGATLYLSRRMVISHDRGPLSFGAMCRERVAWARIFAGRRAESLSVGKRLFLAFLSPAIPLLFLARRWRTVLRTGRSRMALLWATPTLLILFSLWAYGECLGYVTAKDGTT